jgi:hypothetical protein
MTTQKKCLKCNFERQLSHASLPSEACPSCGAVYAKVEAYYAQAAARVAREAHLPTKPKSRSFAIRALILLVVGVGLFVTNFHIISGSNISGLKIVKRLSFGFSEFLINVDEISGLPYISVASKYPLGVKILQREKILESDDARAIRIQHKVEKEIQELLEQNQPTK